jgi:hypothetical protein
MLHCTEWAHQRQWTILPERFSDLRAPIDLQSVSHKLKAYIEDYYRLHMELGSIVSKASTPASAFRCLTSSFYTAFVLTPGNQSRGRGRKSSCRGPESRLI